MCVVYVLLYWEEDGGQKRGGKGAVHVCVALEGGLEEKLDRAHITPIVDYTIAQFSS